MRVGLLSLILQRFQNLPTPSRTAFDGATALITGANTGLGLEVARHLISSGASYIVLAVRDIKKGEVAKEDLLATAGRQNTSVSVDIWLLDMATFTSVKEFVTKVEASDLSFDYVFLNAGLASKAFNKSPDGWEMQLQVNVLSTALLGLLLLHKLGSQSRRSKIIVTTSGLHTTVPFSEWKAENSLDKLNDVINFQSKKNPAEQYTLTKLLDVYITREIAKLAPQDENGAPKIIVNTVAPGLCRTGLQREGPGFPLILFLKLFGRTAEMGSRTLVAAAQLGPESQGGYSENCKLDVAGGMANSADGEKAQEKVWKEITAVLRTVVPDAMW